MQLLRSSGRRFDRRYLFRFCRRLKPAQIKYLRPDADLKVSSTRTPVPTATLSAPAAAWNLNPKSGTGQHFRMARRPSCPCFPTRTPWGILVSAQVRHPTVAPWSFRNPALRRMRRSGTRALRFVASACIPGGKLQRKRRHVSARILQLQFYRIESKTAQPEHYRQAKYDSQNLSNISTGLPAVNPSRLANRLKLGFVSGTPSPALGASSSARPTPPLVLLLSPLLSG